MQVYMTLKFLPDYHVTQQVKSDVDLPQTLLQYYQMAYPASRYLRGICQHNQFGQHDSP